MPETPIYPVLDPVRPVSEMGFTADQLAWLVDIATPRCCHTTGEHDPNHFVDGRYVCSDQLAEVAWRLIGALGMETEPVDRGHYRRRRVDPAVAVPAAACPRCKPDRGAADGR